MQQLVYDVVEAPTSPAVIKVIGVGGGGGNAINNMVANAVKGVELISANTDAQALQNNLAPKRIQLGSKLTKGLGAGANPEIGRSAAQEERQAIADAIRGADMLFITTGMGGGTGTGAAPVVAEIAREMGILTVAIVTRPFEHEGKRINIAKEGLNVLKQHVDSLIVIPNDKLMTVLGDVTVREALRAADNVLRDAVAGITEVVTSPGMINLDFSDVRNVMSMTGVAMMGSGQAEGIDRARLATEQAISSPLLDDVTLEGARGVLVNITTAPNGLKMSEYKEIMMIVSEYAHSDAELKYGTVEDENMAEDAIRVTIIATGLQESGAAPGNNLRMVKTPQSVPVPAQATGTDDILPEISSVSRSNRGGKQARALNLVAADFSNQSVLDDFDVPAVIRRQAD